MDRARRAEPYSNATIWTREIARNLAGHLARISKVHSCVDTKSPKTRLLPKFHHSSAQKRCATSPVKVRHPLADPLSASIIRNVEEPQEREEDDEDHARVVQSELHEVKPTSREKSGHRRHKTPKKAKNLSKKTKMEADRLEMIADENQRLQDRLAKIATPAARQHHHPKPSPIGGSSGGHCSDDSMHEPSMQQHPHTKSSLHDYSKKQEQLKIWTENQAMVKRLRTTKATLNCKEWEKDDKWNQQYLKSQEKRRIILQHEMLKAQMSPQASAVRVTKVNPHDVLESHVSLNPSARNASNVAAEVMVVSSAHESSRRRMNGHSEDNRGESHGPHATAANHRRIMMLRKQRSAPSSDHLRLDSRNDQVGNQNETHMEEDECQSGNDVVNVRFTFSRERSKAFDPEVGVAPLTVDPARGADETCSHNLYMSGAFSPAVELETALEALALDGLEQSDAFEDDEINAVVFDTLQDSIDQIADAFPNQLEQQDTMQIGSVEQLEPPQSCAEASMAQHIGDLVSLTDPVTDAASVVCATSAWREAEATCSELETGPEDGRNNVADDEPAIETHTVIRGSESDQNTDRSDEVSIANPISSHLTDSEAEGSMIGGVDFQHERQREEPLAHDAAEVGTACGLPSGGEGASSPGASEESPEQDAEYYDEEHFDEDANQPGSSEGEAISPSGQVLPERADIALAPGDTEDEASGYGSEFDEDHENDSVGKEAEEDAGDPPPHTDDYDDENYDDDDASIERAKREEEQEMSYSNDGFSEGDDDT